MVSISSYIKDLDNLSVFNTDSFNKTLYASTGAYKVVIESEERRALTDNEAEVPLRVVGVMKGGVSLNTNAVWRELEADTALGCLVSNTPLKTQIMQAAKALVTVGGATAETDLQSKKFYTGGSHLSLPISIRVLDDDNSGKAIKAAITLMALTLPRSKMSVQLDNAIKAVIAKIPNETARNLIGKAELGIENGLQMVAQGIRDQLPKTLKNFATNVYNEISNEEIRLTESPPTISVILGNWLTLRNMILESVTANFSEHCSESGPIHVDLELSIGSRYKMLLDEYDGIKRVDIISNGKRVNISQSSGVFA